MRVIEELNVCENFLWFVCTVFKKTENNENIFSKPVQLLKDREVLHFYWSFAERNPSVWCGKKELVATNFVERFQKISSRKYYCHILLELWTNFI